MMSVGLYIANGDENVTRHVGDTDKTNLSTKTCHIEKGFLQVLLCTYMTMCDSQRSLVEVVKKNANHDTCIYFGYVSVL